MIIYVAIFLVFSFMASAYILYRASKTEHRCGQHECAKNAEKVSALMALISVAIAGIIVYWCWSN